MVTMLYRIQYAEIGLDALKIMILGWKIKKRWGAPKKFENAELETLLSEDAYQTQTEFAESLGVDKSTVFKRLNLLGIIQ